MAGKFQYERPTYENVKERATQRSGTFDTYLKQGTETFKPKEGLNTVRFIPMPMEVTKKLGKPHYGMDIYVHYNVGSDRSSYLCRSKMFKEPCPCCEYHEELTREGATKEELREVESRKSIIAYVMDRDDERSGPKVWPMPMTVDKEFNELRIDADGTYLPIEDPDEGYDVSFTREGKGVATRYTGKKIARNKSYLHRDQDQQDKILEFVTENPLPDLLVWYDYEYISDALNGRAPGGNDDGREDRGRNRDPDPEPRRARDPDPEPRRRTISRDEIDAQPVEPPEDARIEEQIDPATGEVIRPREAGDEQGERDRREAAREPVGRETRDSRPERPSRDERPVRGSDRPSRVADDPPPSRRTEREPEPSRGSRGGQPDTTDRAPVQRRRPAPREEDAPTAGARGRLDSMRERRR